MAKESVYIETSLVSYLVAKPSRDLITAAHQQLTSEWWENRSKNFALFVSPVVLAEASAGDPIYAAKRLQLMNDISVLTVTNEALNLADELVRQHRLPTKAAQDALHIAISTIHGMDYLLTWNCKHIANAQMRAGIEKTCKMAGFQPPILCTPEELNNETD